MALEILNRLWTPDTGPPGVPGRKALICAVPGCDHPPFPMDQERQWERHVMACAKKHADEIEAVYHEHRTNEFKSVTDTEKYGWLRRRRARTGDERVRFD